MSLTNKINEALQLLKDYEPMILGYYLSFSGGKDSMVIYRLCQMAGIDFQAYYHVTGIDPPEVVRFIRRHYHEVIHTRPKRNLIQLLGANSVPPLHHKYRYCCRYLKEYGGKRGGQTVLTGIRAEEGGKSSSRAARGIYERQHRGSGWFLHPIFNWTSLDVWSFIEEQGLPYCELYDQDRDRIGCVGCPRGGHAQQRRDFERWPWAKKIWMTGFERMVKRNKERGTCAPDGSQWQTADEIMKWWMEEKDGG